LDQSGRSGCADLLATKSHIDEWSIATRRPTAEIVVLHPAGLP
jgi:hypothetical protein